MSKLKSRPFDSKNNLTWEVLIHYLFRGERKADGEAEQEGVWLYKNNNPCFLSLQGRLERERLSLLKLTARRIEARL